MAEIILVLQSFGYYADRGPGAFTRDSGMTTVGYSNVWTGTAILTRLRLVWNGMVFRLFLTESG